MADKRPRQHQVGLSNVPIPLRLPLEVWNFTSSRTTLTDGKRRVSGTVGDCVPYGGEALSAFGIPPTP